MSHQPNVTDPGDSAGDIQDQLELEVYKRMPDEMFRRKVFVEFRNIRQMLTGIDSKLNTQNDGIKSNTNFIDGCKKTILKREKFRNAITTGIMLTFLGILIKLGVDILTIKPA